MYVIDASAAIAVCRDANAAILIDRLDEICGSLATPALFRTEVANVAWKYVHAGVDDEAQAKALFGAAANLIDSFAPDESLVVEALSCAILYDHPVYDMMYFVLARRLSVPILTCDTRLCAVCAEHDVSCVLLGDVIDD